MKLKKLLIIDDNNDFRAMLKEYVRKRVSGLEIFEASTGEMGVTKASCIKPDVVLMDVSLPGSNGLEATKCIKEENPDCQVIILTMFEIKMFKDAAKEIAAAEFIGKSEIEERLIPAIKRCFEKIAVKG